MGTQGDRTMKNQFRLFSVLPFFLFLFACAERTEIAPEGDGPAMPSSESSLSGLTIAGATLSPAFDSATETYSVSVANDVDSISFTPTATDTNATITVNVDVVASGTASQPIALAEGDNTITVVVTAEDGATTSTYVISVNRASLSTDSSLSNLTLSDGILSPAFDPATQSYSASVGNDVDSMTVTPTTNDANATVTVNGTAVASGGASGSISLNVGDNSIDAVVTAEDGVSTQTYTVTVTRQAPPASTDASLSDLTLFAAALDQIFQSNNFSYSATVSYAIASTTVTPTTNDANATVTVNGTAVASGNPSGSIALAEGDNTINVVVIAEDGATTQTYTVTVTRQTAETFAQQAYVKASNTGPSDAFGYSLAMDGDTLAVGAFQQGGSATSTPSFSGAVYIFTRTSGVWSQQAYIKASNAGYSYNFGAAVALQGDTLVVGEPNEGTTPASGSIGSGAAYVYVRSNGVWTEQAFLTASNREDNDDFGYSVAVDGDTAVIGAPKEDSSAAGGEDDNSTSSAGAVYVFTRSGTNWTQQDYLKASNAGAIHEFGTAVDLELGTLVIGASNEDSGTGKGAVYVFSESAGNWTQQAHIKGVYTVGSSDFSSRILRFGSAVALSGDTLAAGAPGFNTGTGVVFVYTWTGSSWDLQRKVEASNRGTNDQFGASVSLSGDLLAVGSQGEDGSASSTRASPDDNANNAGAAYVFTRSGTTWSQIEYLKASNADPYDAFANAVAVSGDTIAVGAYGEDSSATGIDGDQSLNDTPTCYSYCAGAVYIFQ